MELIDRLYDQGFELTGTGGGCEALLKMFDDGTHILVTDEEGVGMDNLNNRMMVGFFDKEGDCIFTCGTEILDRGESE